MSENKQHADGCNEDECTCDGYHTFEQLYDHRIRLWLSFCYLFIQGKPSWVERNVWCSTLHSDGSSFGDWFIMGIGKKKGEQITYHLPDSYWNEACEFSEVLEKAPKWDGHTHIDVLERLKTIIT